MIDETINEVGMENIQLFRQVMLFKQIMTNSITLCEECHKEVHRENGANKESEIIKIIEYAKRKKREKEEQKREKQLELYLKQHCGEVMLTLEDRKELIEKIHATDNRGRLLKSATALNAYLEEINSEFRIKQFETSRIIEGKKRKYKSAWKIDKK